MPLPKSLDIDLSRNPLDGLRTGSSTTTKTAQEQIKSAKQSTMGLNILKFPADLNDVFMSFQFYDYRNIEQSSYRGDSGQPIELTRQFGNANKQNVQQGIAATKQPFAMLCLPLPKSLVDSFRVDYQNTSLGVVGAVAAKALQGAMGAKDYFDGVQYNILKREDPASASMIDKVLSSLSNDTGSQATARAILMGTGSEMNDLFDLSTGVASNPNLAVLFRGPTLKEHTFSWRLAPRSASEAQSIAKIVGTFKRAMHPQQLNPATSIFLKYPSECLPQFHGPGGSFLYPIRPCVVEDFTIDYGPNGLPTFFQDGYPTSVTLSVRLQETSYYTRESFADNNQYGSDGLGALSGEGLTQGQLQQAADKRGHDAGTTAVDSVVHGGNGGLDFSDSDNSSWITFL